MRPDFVTLVPEKREERTTEGGLTIAGQRGAARRDRAPQGRRHPGQPVHRSRRRAGACERRAGRRARRAAHRRLLRGVHALDDGSQPGTPAHAELGKLERAAALGHELGLHVAAGHGLDYANVGPVAAIAAIAELNIGHAIVARAVLVGMERAVREMREAMSAARPK